MRILVPTILLSCLLTTTAARADDEAEAVAKQKAAAEANWKALEIATPPKPVETAGLLVYSTLPEARTKGASEALQRQYATAAKALKFDADGKPWPGKLTVYLFAERPEFNSFMRQIEGRRPLAEESAVSSGRGTTPYAVAVAGEKDAASVEWLARWQVAVAMIQARAGSGPQLPGWVRNGFARAVTARADPKLYAAERAKIRAAGADRARKPADAWTGEGKDPEYTAASLMDYLAFGPEAAKLGAFLKGFSPGEDGTTPTAAAALEAAKIDAKGLEAAWKKWAAGGK